MTLRKRLFLFFFILAVLILVIPNLLIGWAMQQHFLMLAQREGEEITQRIQSFIDFLALKNPEISLDLHNPDKVQEILDNTSRYLLNKEGLEIESGFFLEIRGPQGDLIAASANLKNETLPQSNEKITQYLKIKDFKAIPVLIQESQLQVRNQNLGTVRVAVSLLENNYFIKQLLVFWLVSLMLTLILTFFLANLFSQQALKPLVSLSSAVDQMISTGTLTDLKTQGLPPDPIGMLARSFNALLHKIQELLIKQQDFLADASHELRSPLTAIQGHAELLLKRGATHPEILEEGLGIIRQESERLSALVEDMLLLAKTRQTAPHQEELEINKLLQEVYEARQMLHPQLVFLPSHEELWVKGEKAALQRVFINLIDNALRYSPPEKEVKIISYAQDQQAHIEIQDQGPGIPEDKLPHIFERFYRLEPDRNRSQGGTGLGLPIVKEVLNWHAGEIKVFSQLLAGSCFRVSLPSVNFEALALQETKLDSDF